LNKNFQVVSKFDLEFQSKKIAILTFDDGLKDHFINVFPRLRRLGLSGQFFVSSAPLLNQVVLDVHKIQLFLASQSIDDLFVNLKDRMQGMNVADDIQRDLYSHDDERFDDAQTLTFKRLLQRDLPKEIREYITNSIFELYFPGEEQVISKHLYMTIAEIQKMKKEGMVIGNHTESHQWLSYLEFDEALREVEECEDILNEIGVMPSEEKIIAYPYGDVSPQLTVELQIRGYKFGYTTEPTNLTSYQINPLLIPRLDTNDLPID
jgi:peptidoglycan/xylan/chitin deacetylase (PgdA/CDA1 family)